MRRGRSKDGGSGLSVWEVGATVARIKWARRHSHLEKIREETILYPKLKNSFLSKPALWIFLFFFCSVWGIGPSSPPKIRYTDRHSINFLAYDDITDPQERGAALSRDLMAAADDSNSETFLRIIRDSANRLQGSEVSCSLRPDLGRVYYCSVIFENYQNPYFLDIWHIALTLDEGGRVHEVRAWLRFWTHFFP